MNSKQLFELNAGDHFYFKDDRYKTIWWVDDIDLESKVNLFGMMSEIGTYYLFNDMRTFKAEVKNRDVIYLKTDLTKCLMYGLDED